MLQQIALNFLGWWRLSRLNMLPISWGGQFYGDFNANLISDVAIFIPNYEEKIKYRRCCTVLFPE